MLGSHEVLQVPLTCLVPWQPGLCAPVGPGCESAQTRTFPSGQGRSKVKVPEVPAQGTSVPGTGCSAGDDRTARVGAGAGVSSSGSDPHGQGVLLSLPWPGSFRGPAPLSASQKCPRPPPSHRHPPPTPCLPGAPPTSLPVTPAAPPRPSPHCILLVLRQAQSPVTWGCRLTPGEGHLRALTHPLPQLFSGSTLAHHRPLTERNPKSGSFVGLRGSSSVSSELEMRPNKRPPGPPWPSCSTAFSGFQVPVG